MTLVATLDVVGSTNQLSLSTDGGQMWKNIPVPPVTTSCNIYSLSVANTTNWVGIGYKTAMLSNNVITCLQPTLIWTNDSGASWVADNAGFASTGLYPAWHAAMASKDFKKIIVLEDDYIKVRVESNNGLASYYQTYNSIVNSDILGTSGNGDLSAFAFFSKNNAYLKCFELDPTSSFEKYTLRSLNAAGNRMWNSITVSADFTRIAASTKDSFVSASNYVWLSRDKGLSFSQFQVGNLKIGSFFMGYDEQFVVSATLSSSSSSWSSSLGVARYYSIYDGPITVTATVSSGQVTNQLAQVGASNFKSCRAGLFSSGGSAACTPCPVGSFNIGSGSTTCT